jgi:hypothetical protein
MTFVVTKLTSVAENHLFCDSGTTEKAFTLKSLVHGESVEDCENMEKMCRRSDFSAKSYDISFFILIFGR